MANFDFTRPALAKLKAPADGADLHRDTGYGTKDGSGSLGVRISSTGAATVFVQFRVGEKNRKVSLCKLLDFLDGNESVKDLRERARKTVEAEKGQAAKPVVEGVPTFAQFVGTRENPGPYFIHRAEHKPYIGEGLNTAWRMAARAVEAFGQKRIDEITAKDALDMIRANWTKSQNAARLQAQRILGGLFNYARGNDEDGMGLEYVPANPFSKLIKDRYEARTVILEPTELEQFWAALDAYGTTGPTIMHVTASDRADIFRALLLRGWRKTAVLSLRWDELDLDKATRQLVQHKPETWTTEVRMTDELVALLRARRDALPSRPAWWRESPFVFPAPPAMTDGCGCFKDVRDTFKSVVKLAGMEGIGLHIHDLRACFVTTMLDNGLTPDEVIKYTGHRTTKEVGEVYDRWTDSRGDKVRAKASGVMQAVVTGSTGQAVAPADAMVAELMAQNAALQAQLAALLAQDGQVDAAATADTEDA